MIFSLTKITLTFFARSLRAFFYPQPGQYPIKNPGIGRGGDISLSKSAFI
jgi:hypothetical protein